MLRLMTSISLLAWWSRSVVTLERVRLPSRRWSPMWIRTGMRLDVTRSRLLVLVSRVTITLLLWWVWTSLAMLLQLITALSVRRSLPLILEDLWCCIVGILPRWSATCRPLRMGLTEWVRRVGGVRIRLPPSFRSWFHRTPSSSSRLVHLIATPSTVC